LPLTQGTPAGGTYSGPGVANNIFDPGISGTGVHTITYTYTDPVTGCTNTIDQSITIDPGIIVNVNPVSAYICPNSSIMLNASGADSYVWTPQVGLNTATGPVVVATPPSNIVYTVTGTNDNGCSGSVTSTINFYNTSLVSITSQPDWGCNPVEVNMSFAPQSMVMDSTWHWNFGDYYSNDNSSTDKFPSHLYLHEGNYVITFTAKDINGCDIFDYEPFEVYLTPVADFYFNPVVAYTDNPTVHFYDLSIGASFWSWNFGDPPSFADNYSDVQNPYHIFSDSGTYDVLLIVTSSHNCSDTVNKPVTVIPSPLIYIANAFTPDRDGYNEDFKPSISGIDEKKYKFYIFDRWGKEQFFTSDVDEGWEGTFNGINSEMGVYVYLIIYQTLEGKEYKLKGTVTLLR